MTSFIYFRSRLPCDEFSIVTLFCSASNDATASAQCTRYTLLRQLRVSYGSPGKSLTQSCTCERRETFFHGMSPQGLSSFPLLLLPRIFNQFLIDNTDSKLLTAWHRQLLLFFVSPVVFWLYLTPIYVSDWPFSSHSSLVLLLFMRNAVTFCSTVRPVNRRNLLYFFHRPTVHIAQAAQMDNTFNHSYNMHLQQAAYYNR